MLRVVGITGKMAVGKSYVSSLFSEFGALLFNTDIYAQKVQMHNVDLRNKLIALYGKEYFDGINVNKEFVTNLLFGGTEESRKELKKITNLVGKYVIVELSKYIEQLEASGIDNTYVLVESAILFETGLNSLCSLTINVTSPNPLGAAWERSMINKEQYEIRMQTQLPLSEKNFDYTVGNDYTDNVRTQVETIHNEIMKKICQ